VLATNGDTRLGGDDLDREIISLLADGMHKQFGQDLAMEKFPPATRQALRDFAEAAKIRLSEESEARVRIDLGEGRLFERTITREQFEAVAAGWVEHTLEHCRQALDDAKLKPAEIDEVILVGGTTRMPLVRRRVGEFFARTPYTALHPEQVVALGAAVQAGILAGGSREMLLLDVTPLSLGIETLGGAMGKLIMRNSTIPASVSETFTTSVDGQTSVDINILQGERELARDCRELGRFQLRGIPPMPAGAPRVQVTFVIDANGILNVSARELRSGREAAVQVTPAYGLTGEEVDAMVAESIAHARADMTVHRLIDVRNEVRRVLAAIDKALSDASETLRENQRRELDARVTLLKAKLETSDDPDELYAAMRAANDAAMPLTQTQMDDVLAKALKGRKANALGPQIETQESQQG
jgi:molecular chaperone DnaK (HSP70)